MLRTLETLLALPALEFRKTDRMRVTEEDIVGGIKIADGLMELDLLFFCRIDSIFVGSQHR